MDVQPPLQPFFSVNVSILVESAFLALPRQNIATHVRYRIEDPHAADVAPRPDSLTSATAHYTRRPSWSSPVSWVRRVPQGLSGLLSASAEGGGLIRITFEDAVSREFYGQVEVNPITDFTSGTARRFMLQPRAVVDGSGDGNAARWHAADVKRLAEARLDDFGVASLSCRVQVHPCGPAIQRPTGSNYKSPAMMMLRAFWLLPRGATPREACVKSPAGPLPLGDAPTYLPVYSPSDFNVTMSFAWDQQSQQPAADVAVAANLCLAFPSHILNQELVFSVPVLGTVSQQSFLGQQSPSLFGGGIAVLIFKAATAAVDFAANVVSAALPDSIADNSRPPNPQVGKLFTSPGTNSYVGGSWQSASHFARATERRWRRSCVLDSKPTLSHIAQLATAIREGQSPSASFQPLLVTFFNLSTSTGNTALPKDGLEQLLVALTFACPELSVPEACLVAAASLQKKDSEPPSAGAQWAAKVASCVFVAEHCLLPLTLDLTPGDITRVVHDLFPAMPVSDSLSFPDFVECFANNCGFWFLFAGSTVAAEAPNSSGRSSQNAATTVAPLVPFHRQGGTTMGGGGSWSTLPGRRPAQLGDAAATTGAAGSNRLDDGWRSFVVRVARTKKGFAVTAQVTDTMLRVARMIEGSVEIPASKQRLVLQEANGTLVELEGAQTVGSVIPESNTGSAPGNNPGRAEEVLVYERDEAVSIVLVHRAKERKWELKLPLQEKVLKLRSIAQQKTMMPLSRIELTCLGQTLWDRHSLTQSRLVEGSVVEVVEKKTF